MASVLDRVYARAPVAIQHAMVSAFGARWRWRRFGPGYESELQGFLARTTFTEAQWRDHQTRTLRELLTVAWTRIPYYRRAWASLGLSTETLARFELADLRQLPVLDKEAVRADPDAFCLDGRAPRGAIACNTSGSTGTPVRAYFTNADFRRGMALREARTLRPAGVSYRLPRATFSARLVVPDTSSQGPFYRFNAFERQVYYSSFHLSPKTAAAYLEPLRRHGIVWGTGYTNTWEQLASFMLEQGLEPPPTLKAIVTTSEKLSAAGRAIIERAFRCRVIQEYGTVEEAVFACEDEHGRMRLAPDAGILELQRPDKTFVEPTSTDEGETITTAFTRRSQLFIRYRLGDVAAWDPTPDASGLAMPFLADVIGRLDDVVEGPDGRRTTRFNTVFSDIAGVREAQVIQEARDRLRIHVVSSPGYTEDTAREIVRRIHARLSPAMNVDVECVASIPRTAAGKFKAVVNRIPR